jgi:lactate dehydrogenase-like 2-hydroxyacid dehydrogenase
MKPGAILITYDRGELVDTQALDLALSTGQISYAAIDADVFKDAQSVELSGPMKAYLDICPKHVGKMQLLPHAGADTEHNSRVTEAKQAVDPLFALILQRKVINLKGDLPLGYSDAKALTVKAVILSLMKIYYLVVVCNVAIGFIY